MVKRKHNYSTWSALIFIILIGLLINRWIIGYFQLSFVWLLLISILAFFSVHRSGELSPEVSKAPRTVWWIPLLIGSVVTAFHFGLSYFLFEPGTDIGSDRNMISSYFMIPGWLITSLLDIDNLLHSLGLTSVNRYYATMLISSFYFGFASSLLEINRKPYSQIGAVLWALAFFLGGFVNWALLATGG